MCRRRPNEWTRRAGKRLGVIAAGVLGSAWTCAAQVQEGESGPEQRVERYMERLGMDELLAAQLRDRLVRTPTSQRVEIAEQLARIYVRQLRAATDLAERKRIERLADELLASVDDAQSYDLRIEIAKARYLEAEEIAERVRLLLADEAQRDEAVRVLGSVRTVFGQIGARLNREVESLERAERATSNNDRLTEIERALSEARRLRSLGKYYSGWTNYYLAELTQQPNLAMEAIGDFAYLLNAAGEKTPPADKLPRNLLQYEHVARAALGVAMAAAIRGDDTLALRWLDVVTTSEEVPESVHKQVFSRRIIVYAAAKRWADIEWMLHQRSRQNAEAMSVQEARLLAVKTLSALKQARGGEPQRDVLVQALAQTALAELIRRGEVGHVLDLVSAFDADIIGSDGFIVRYVNGLRQYEATRKSHTEAGESDQEPTALPVIATRYRQAALMLRQAAEAEDAEAFAAQRNRCLVLAGLALYYAGDLEQAAKTLERVFTEASDAGLAEEALWYAIVALDRAVEGERAMLKDKRDELSAIFLQRFPRSERAAKLLIRRAASDLANPEQAVRVLLAVEGSSPLYHAARSHASTLLYRLYRSARSDQRDFAALQFVEVAEEVVGLDQREAQAGDADLMQRLSEGALLRLRQIADALLSMSAPDYARAARTLEMIEQTAKVAGVSVDQFADELLYRRLQLALGQGRLNEVEEHLTRLRAMGGLYAEAADNLMYRHALTGFLADPENSMTARTLLRHGLRLADTAGAKPGALQRPAIQSVFNRAAEAAAVLWKNDKDVVARDAGVRLDGALLAAGIRAPTVLRRHAELAEAAGEEEAALESWRVLLSGLTPAASGWHEARYHSARLLALENPRKALEALDQHATLYPEYGPAPWGEALKRLHEEVRARVAAMPSVPAGEVPGGPAGGSLNGEGGGGE